MHRVPIEESLESEIPPLLQNFPANNDLINVNGDTLYNSLIGNDLRFNEYPSRRQVEGSIKL